MDSLPTEEDLKQQKEKLTGMSRHDTEETRKYQKMLLNVKHNIEIGETQISTKVYNGICGYQNKSKRLEAGRGKYTRKQKKNTKQGA